MPDYAKRAASGLSLRLHKAGGLGGKTANGLSIKEIINAAMKASKVPGKANTPGDSEKNDTTLIAASPGEGVIPRSIMQKLAHMSEGGQIPEPGMDDLDKLETEDEYSKRRTEEAKKYKKAKPGDPGVVSFDLDEEPPKKIPKMADGGVVPENADQHDAGLMQAIRDWWTGKGQPSDVAEEANKKLPDMLSGRSAVLKKRQQLKDLDEQTKE